MGRGEYTRKLFLPPCAGLLRSCGTVVKPSRPSIPCTPCFLSLSGASKYARLKGHTVGQFPPFEGFHSLINTLIGKVFGTKNERVIKTMMPKVEAINALEPQMQKLTDAELRAKTDEFRRRIQERLSHFTPVASPEAEGAEGEEEAGPDRAKRLEKEQYAELQEVLDEILVEAFAVVREAGRRVLNMRHFDVQLIGGMVQHK